jgi:hypothetical protein
LTSSHRSAADTRTFDPATAALEPVQNLRLSIFVGYARRIVGWRVSRSAHAGFVLDALEQALHDRKPVSGALVHHSDRGVQYVSIKYKERLADAGLVPSVGCVRVSYNNALAETTNGLYKAEVIHRRGPWRSLEAVEHATLNGSAGSTTAGFLSRSDMCRGLKPKPPTTQPWRNLPRSPPDSTNQPLRNSGQFSSLLVMQTDESRAR